MASVAPTFVTSTTFVTAHQFLSIHINSFCQPRHFCKLLSTQGSPVLSTISTTYVARDEVTTFVNRHFIILPMCAMLSHTLK